MSEKNYDIYLDLGSSKIRATAFDKQEKNQIFFLEKDCLTCLKLSQLKILGKQILLGVSRKSFVGEALNLEPAERLEGSIAAGIVGIINGANILRVHDVGPTVRAVRIASALMKTSLKND